MFTGIITDLGRVRSVSTDHGDRRFVLETGYDPDSIEIGGSIACSGVCLTAVETGPGWFGVEASAETLGCTTLGQWRAGASVNLERPLTLGAELGGHMVLGHADGVARVRQRVPEGGSVRFSIEFPAPLAGFIAAKGSVALDGVSLTVNEVDAEVFGVNVIGHSLARTTFGELGEGDMVNIEVDMLARYVARLLEKA